MATRRGCALSREPRVTAAAPFKERQPIFQTPIWSRQIRPRRASQSAAGDANMTDNVTPLLQPGALPRVTPINIEAEQHLLGAFLCNNRRLDADRAEIAAAIHRHSSSIMCKP
jgi:hypothetical protein